MNKIIKKISQAVQVLLLAPIKLLGKALNIIKYVAVGLGILEAVTRKEVNELSSDQVNELSSDQVNESDKVEEEQ
ncbi:hypothetical protein [Sphingobacterium faecale]|uniref:YtxH domain-containing protein n=1 Tax=Sphingobacterium faecale TaxID=2803775 RepID=A0ABS1R049_9SPHI|nr:hypothetical protein [Sphingobacterium faecale]MBL1408073.1 hypothetical protein [Sphingobacterium faecale]